MRETKGNGVWQFLKAFGFGLCHWYTAASISFSLRASLINDVTSLINDVILIIVP